MADQEVITWVRQLHSGVPTAVGPANEWLSKFQNSGQAWSVAHSLLNNPQHPLEVLHFAASTICCKVQAGLESLGDSAKDFKDALVKLLGLYCSGPTIVLRQLSLALCALAIHMQSWEDSVSSIIQLFSASPDQYGVLLEVLSLLPEEVTNRRVLTTPHRRALYGMQLVSKTELVFDALTRILGNSPSNPKVECSVLKCFASWLNGQYGVVATPTEDFTHPILSKLADSALLGLAFNRLPSQDLDLSCVSGEVLVELLTLSDELNDITEPMLLAYVSAVSNLHKFLTGMRDDPDFLERVKILCRLLGAFGENQFPDLLYADKDSYAGALEAIIQAALFVISIQHVELGEAALDFWYNLLTHHLCTPEQAEAEYGPEDEDPAEKVARLEGLKQRRTLERAYLVPLYQRMVQTMCVSVRYPETPEDDPDFDVEEFVKLREQYGISLTEACVVVGHSWVLEFVGAALTECSQKINQGSKFPWNEVEGHIFMLTTVAPRAPAGKDNIIPSMLNLLPTLPYPTSGTGGLLMRSGAGRLIHYTSGYLGMNGPAALMLGKFMTESLIPTLVQIHTDDKMLKTRCESTCVQALYIMVSESAKVLCEMGQDKLEGIVQAIGGLIGNEAVSLDSRAILVMAAGAAVSVLPLNQMESAIFAIASPLAAQVDQVLKQNPAEVRPQAKLFFSVLQSIKPRSGPVQPNESHPLIEVLGKFWPLIEDLFTKCKAQDVIMQEGFHCIATVISITRTHAMSMVVPFLHLLVKCFLHTPMIFHLGAARTVAGLFGNTPDEALRQVLCDMLQALGGDVLRRLQEGTNFLFNQPDIVGMYYDTLAAGLVHAPLAILIMQSEWIKPIIAATLPILPECHHPKVMAAMLLLIQRLTAWLFRPVPDQFRAANESSMELIKQCLGPLLGALMSCLAAQASSNSQSVALLAVALSPILSIPNAKDALGGALQQIPSIYMTDAQKAEFYKCCTEEDTSDPRNLVNLLQDTAQQCTAQWLKSREGGAQ